MKKIISFVLILCLALSACVTAFASESSSVLSPLPTIVIAGDAEPIYYDNDTKQLRVDDFGAMIGGDGESGGASAVASALANIFIPMFAEGVAFNVWDDYYDAIEKEVGDLFDPIALDENGNPKGDSGISQKRVSENEYNMTHDKKNKSGKYAFSSYRFWYDWRLDPLEVAETLHDYIGKVKSVTGKDQVNIITRCLGTSVVFAYIEKYGTDDIHGWGIDGCTTNGSEFMSGALTGDFAVDGNAIARTIHDYEWKPDAPSWLPILSNTIAILENSGALNGVTNLLKRTIYSKIEKGVVSAIALGTVFTMPCYWALISRDKYDTAMEYVFGPEGSEKRQTYAGLIEKIENYHEKVGLHLDEILLNAKDSDIKIGIISKYGYTIVPIIKDNDLVSDLFASVHSSSFGATTSRINQTLPKEYIEERISLGYANYISPDKQIDASTCLLPECTWFLKGAHHIDWTTGENELLMEVVSADEQLTTTTARQSRFSVYDFDTQTTSTMTEENCHTEHWTDDDFPDVSTKQGKIRALLTSLFKIVITLLGMLVEKI